MKPHVRILAATCTPLLFLLCTSCGLEFIPYLDPPTVDTVSATPFRFRGPADEYQFEFRGFELYYKFLEKLDSVTDIQNIASLTDLGREGFRRVHSARDTQDSVTRPLIGVDVLDRGTSFTVLVDFTDASAEPYALVDLLGYEQAELRRGVLLEEVAGVTRHYREFRDFDLDAPDLPPGMDLTNTVELRLALYALSYGVANYTNPIHSTPAFIGVVDISGYLSGPGL